MLSFLIRYLLVAVGAMAMTSVSYAQKQGREKIDSLEKVLSSTSVSPDRIELLGKLSFSYFPFDPSKGIAYGENCLGLAIKYKSLKGEAMAYNALGANYWAKRSFSRAQDFYLKALKINTRLNDKREMARNIHNIADIYARFSPQKAIAYYQKALGIVKELKDNDAVLGFQANIANVLQNQGDYTQALAYYQRSVDLAKALHMRRDVAAYLILMSPIQSQLGEHRKAQQSATEALAIFREINPKNPIREDLPKALLNVAMVYGQNGDSRKSVAHNREAIHIFRSLGGNINKDFEAQALSSIGNTYLKEAETAPQTDAVRKNLLLGAKKAFMESIKISEGTKQWDVLSVALKSLSLTEQLLGDPSSALQHYKRHSAYKDSLYNAEMNRDIASRQMEFEYGQEKDSLNNLNRFQAGKIQLLAQQQILDRLKAKQQWLYFLVALAVLCLLAFYFLYRYRLAQLRLYSDLAKEKMAKQVQEAEYRRNMNQNTLAMLISQMNPHFIFNALNTVQSYIYSNNKELAISYLGKFGELTRKILDNSRKEAIPLEEELLLLDLYLDIEQARFGSELEISVHVADEVDTESYYIPPMLIQPFVENAIKHGLLHVNGKKKLAIRITKPKTAVGGLEISIDDNGVGRKRSMELNRLRKGHRPFASDANNRRIELINFHLDDPKHKIHLKIIDKEDQDGTALGTTALLSVPCSLY